MLSQKKREENSKFIGAAVKAKRETIGMTQKALADSLGLSYYTMISQIENGYVTLPPALWVPVAHALRFDPEDWVVTCLDRLQPDVYFALFGTLDQTKVIKLLKSAKGS